LDGRWIFLTVFSRYSHPLVTSLDGASSNQTPVHFLRSEINVSFSSHIPKKTRPQSPGKKNLETMSIIPFLKRKIPKGKGEAKVKKPISCPDKPSYSTVKKHKTTGTLVTLPTSCDFPSPRPYIDNNGNNHNNIIPNIPTYYHSLYYLPTRFPGWLATITRSNLRSMQQLRERHDEKRDGTARQCKSCETSLEPFVHQLLSHHESHKSQINHMSK